MKRAFLFALLLLIGVGCGKDDPVKPKTAPAPPLYPSASQPESVLLRYAYAWTRRDSVMIDSVIADDYTGSSIDLTDTNPQAIPFTKADEVRVVATMARSNVYASVDLYPPQWGRQVNLSDPASWVTVNVPNVRITVDDISTATEYTAQGSLNNQFTFKPITPAPSSPTDTTWQLVRWEEKRL